MELRQLRYFIAVAEELHFGRAARRLAISQPPLSYNIQQLESLLGTQLLERSNKAVSLTAAGDILYREAKKILNQVRDAEYLTVQAAKGLIGRLRIGFSASSLFRGLPEAIEKFQEQAPMVDIVLHELNSAEQIEALQRKNIDLGLVHSKQVPIGVKAELLLKEPFLCCLPSTHRLAGKRVIRLKDLAGENFILFSRPSSPHYYDRIIAMCINAGFSPKIRHEVRHFLTMVTLVEKKMSIAIVPRSVSNATLKHVIFRPIADAKETTETSCIWRESDNSVLLEAFVSSLKEFAGRVDDCVEC